MSPPPKDDVCELDCADCVLDRDDSLDRSMVVLEVYVVLLFLTVIAVTQ